MIAHVRKQYALLRVSREILFGFLESAVGDEALNAPVPMNLNKSIRDVLVHDASCYFHWLAYLALGQPWGSLYEGGTTMEEMRGLYAQVDRTMALFLEQYAASMDVAFTGVLDDGWRVTVTPHELFTHVTTHAFHHKGQIVLMCRWLGHVPPDTDVSNAFQAEAPDSGGSAF